MVKKKLNQTEMLSAARWELLNRNPGAKKNYDQNEVIQLSREFCKKHGRNSEEIERKSMALPAATGYYAFLEFTRKHPDFFTEPMSDEELNKKFLNVLFENACFLFRLLTVDRPFDHLLMGINLTRSKEAIMAEVEELVAEYQNFYRGGEPLKERLKWLAVIDSILEVWDMWVERGEPARQSFPKIAKTLNIPESTVKARWYRAFELIYGKPYDPDAKNQTEEKVKKAEELCAKCPHGAICYKTNNWIPCPGYLNIAGSEKKITSMEYRDDLSLDKDGRKRPKKSADRQ